MVGLLIAIITFNLIAFKTNKKLTMNQIIHIWTFTISLQSLFDFIIEFKYYAYWYFDKEVDWIGLLPHIFLLPPINMMFLNWYPRKGALLKQFLYIILTVVIMLIYEIVATLQEPWGYFYYGWWTIWHSAILDPILLFILMGYYKWIQFAEDKLLQIKCGK